MTQEQIDYIRKQIESGVSVETLKTTLRSAGYGDQLIEELLNVVNEVPYSNLDAIQDTDYKNQQAITTTKTLPSHWEFIKMSLSLRFDLLLLAVVGLVGWAIFGAILVTFSSGNNILLPFSNDVLLSFGNLVVSATGLISLYLFFAAMATLLRQDCSTAYDGLKWANRNFLSLLWIAVLMTLVQFTGFTLFILPGVAISGYVILAYPVRIAEEQKGFQALVRSTALVNGYWWSVISRLLSLTLTVFLPVFLILLSITILLDTFFGTLLESPWFAVIINLLLSISLIINAHALSILYKYLLIINGASSVNKASVRWLYIICALLLPAIILFLTSFLSSSDRSTDSREAALDYGSERELLLESRLEVEFYSISNGDSYEGACTIVNPEIDCVAESDSYRLSMQRLDGRFECIDNIIDVLVTLDSILINSLRCQ